MISEKNSHKAIGNQFNLPQRVLKDILFLAQKHGIQKVILFGSRARGNNSERSDIDIAVYGNNFDAFYWDIKEQVHSLLSFDIVDLNTNISDELKEQITLEGVVLYEKT